MSDNFTPTVTISLLEYESLIEFRNKLNKFQKQTTDIDKVDSASILLLKKSKMIEFFSEEYPGHYIKDVIFIK